MKTRHHAKLDEIETALERLHATLAAVTATLEALKEAMPTEKQVRYLIKLGVDRAKAITLTKAEARVLISSLVDAKAHKKDNEPVLKIVGTDDFDELESDVRALLEE